MALDLDKIRGHRDAALEEAARRSARFFELQPKRNVVRILPPWEGADDFSRIMAKHWNLGPEGKTVVFCPKVSFGMPCPICDEIDKLWKSKPDDAMKEWLKTVSATPRFLVNVVDVNDPEAGVQIAEFPKTVLLEIWNIMVDKDTGYGDITDLKNGRDILIDKVGKGLSTRYTVRAKLAASPAPAGISMTDIPNLDNFVRKESYENLKRIWEGKEPIAAAPAKMITDTTTVVKSPTPVEDPPVEDPIEAEFTPVPTTADALEQEVEKRLEEDAAPPTTDTADSLPECFGSFDEANNECLNCAEQDDCEMKALEIKREARKAKAAKAAKPAPKKATSRKPVTTVASDPTAEISTEDLMAEMEDAINK